MECFRHARALAERHELTIWRIHALVRIVTLDYLSDGDPAGLEHARQEALRIGAITISYNLDALGMTIREYEVFELLAERIGNKAVAQRLHISPRTVEKHVANLLMKPTAPAARPSASTPPNS